MLVSMVIELWMWSADLNYNIECDWLIELSDNNLASELLENRSFKALIIKEIVKFMINNGKYFSFK